MTIIDQYPPLSPELTVDPTSALPFDAYRDVHKGIRAELFAVVSPAGHDDTHVLPVFESHAPALFERISTDHAALDRRVARIAERATTITGAAPSEQRARIHNLYLDLSSFTG